MPLGATAAVSAEVSVAGRLVSPLVSKLLEHSILKDWEEKRDLEKGLNEEMKSLRSVLSQIKGITQDVEKKQLMDSSVRDWVGKLKDVLLDAEDVIDLHQAEAAELLRKKQGDTEPSSQKKVTFYPSGLLSREKIEDIRERLDGIRKVGLKFRLEEMVRSDPAIDSGLLRNKDTSSFLGDEESSIFLGDEESSFVGRDDVKEEMIRQLLPGDGDDKERMLALPIVGMGGLGKTTLAQHLFDDTRVVDFYKSRAWVYVGHSYYLDLKETTRNIIESARAFRGYKEACNFRALEPLQRTLVDEIKEPFLLVLDNAWNSSIIVWEKLLAPLKDSKKRCRVIVTTRDQKVADAIPHRSQVWKLGLLDNVSLHSIFTKAASFDTTDDASKLLEPIGEEIIQSLNGLPFAAKTIGGLLRGKKDAAYWESISQNARLLNNNQDKDFMLFVLMLSYHSLPDIVKQFFSCFSLFPKDYQFEYKYERHCNVEWLDYSDTWTIQEFAAEEQRNVRWLNDSDTWMIQRLSLIPAEIDTRYSASNCVNGLLDRSLLQYMKDGTDISMSMHDSIHDMSEWINEGEFLRIDDDAENKLIPKKTRHISFFQKRFDPDAAILKDLSNFKFLRTLLYNNWGERVDNSHGLLHGWFELLRYLRVLSLYNLHITSLPDSIGNLKLLRYLDLCLPELKELPHTVSYLYKLQGLNLHGCVSLRKLPSSVTRLVNLMHLDVRTMLLQKVDGIGQFTNLQELKEFHVEERQRHGISQLENMNGLGGSLSIFNLDKVTDRRNAMQAQLDRKEKLQRLELSWNYGQRHADVVEGLRPHTELKELSIEGYRGTCLPGWLTDNYLVCLVCLDVSDCPNLEHIPSLPCTLQSLLLSSNYNLRSLFNFSPPPTSLQRLQVSCCRELRDLNVLLKASSSSLRYLEILDYCWPLEDLSCVTALSELKLRRCNEDVVLNFTALTSLTKMVIEHCPKLHVIRRSTYSELRSSLTHLRIESSYVLELLRQRGVLLPSLAHLDICYSECDDSTLSECLCNATLLKELRLESCDNITSLPLGLMERLAATKKLYIRDCQNLMVLAFPPAANISIAITGCPKFHLSPPILNPTIRDLAVQGLSGEQLLRLFKAAADTPIRSIKLTSCFMEEDTIASVLGGTYQNTTLEVFEIYDCQGLLSRDLSPLRSLECLTICNSSTITSLPVLSSLLSLSIKNCHNLDFKLKEASAPFFPKLRVLHATEFSKQQLTDLIRVLAKSPVKSITITRCDELESLEGDLGLALHAFKNSMRGLSIENCYRLQCLPPHLKEFEALRRLVIHNCPQMSISPDGPPPSSLRSLGAIECPELKKLYEKGNRWFSNIPDVSFR